jgi:hypothetical protein
MSQKTTYHCDGCGAEISEAEPNTRSPDTRPVVMTTITIDQQRAPGYYGDRKEYELCNDCAAPLNTSITLFIGKKRADSGLGKR